MIQDHGEKEVPFDTGIEFKSELKSCSIQSAADQDKTYLILDSDWISAGLSKLI